ncbi:ribonuclease P protein component [Methylobacterium trifolii]|uniref:Ribonuclease P protein component n=1 Tax=Methylobacterium trifolii TaxID=1003092 RepID=A0ABQ4U575_9HYPH|nr:ribonuclease P protein component [Methylobacterium trifolii]GJE61992.1 Ribonuclease P protein component [Methylobacterium trifolii]
MPTIERLRKRPDFLAAAEGRRFHTERMTAQGRLREAGSDPAAAGLRLGFTITKRVGHAPERNRIRRRLRAAVRAVAADLPVLPADVVLIARRPALQAPFETLKDDLRRAISAALKPRGPKEGAKDGTRGGDGRPRRSGTKSAHGRGAGGGGVPPTPSRRDAGPPAAPSSTPNACGGVPDGQ